MRKILPIVLIWRDKTIDMKGQHELKVPYLYVGKGRHLKLINTARVFILKVNGSVTITKSKISIVPKGMTEADLEPIPPEKIHINARNYQGTLAEKSQ